LKHQTPIQALKAWREKKPELFVKKVYEHTGLDNINRPDVNEFRESVIKEINNIDKRAAMKTYSEWDKHHSDHYFGRHAAIKSIYELQDASA